MLRKSAGLLPLFALLADAGVVLTQHRERTGFVDTYIGRAMRETSEVTVAEMLYHAGLRAQKGSVHENGNGVPFFVRCRSGPVRSGPVRSVEVKRQASCARVIARRATTSDPSPGAS